MPGCQIGAKTKQRGTPLRVLERIKRSSSHIANFLASHVALARLRSLGVRDRQKVKLPRVEIDVESVINNVGPVAW